MPIETCREAYEEALKWFVWHRLRGRGAQKSGQLREQRRPLGLGELRFRRPIARIVGARIQSLQPREYREPRIGLIDVLAKSDRSCTKDSLIARWHVGFQTGHVL